MRKIPIIRLILVLCLMACRLFQPFSLVEPTATLVLHDALQINIDNATMVFYEISGSTADELREQMNQKGPVDSASRLRYDARTNWYVSWTWPGYGESQCDLSQASVSYDIKVTAPHWEPAPDADPDLVDRWNNYMNSLAVHEQGHVDNIVNNYLQVRDAIRDATCATAEQAAQEVLDQFRQFDTDYDLETVHGKTQGAVFP